MTTLDPSNRFSRYTLPADFNPAEHVSPVVLAYIQNKISDYAAAIVERQLPYHSDPTQQVAAILAHEKLRNYVEILEELLSELTSPN